MIQSLLKLYGAFAYVAFDPLGKLNQYRALPAFVSNYLRFRKGHHSQASFPLRFSDFYITTADKFQAAGSAKGHYFFQDLWAASAIFQRDRKTHVDVGSRMDGFVAHVLPFCEVTYVDIRPLGTNVPNLAFKQGSVTQLPFEPDSVESLSCLHVIEHIGLGRYGDPIDPEGHVKAAIELARVLKPGGRLYIGAPVGKQRICYDAHRVFHPQTLIDMFRGLKLVRFHLIDDKGEEIFEDAAIARAAECNYGCGLFEFEK